MFMQVVVKVVWNRAVFYSVQETSMKKNLCCKTCQLCKFMCVGGVMMMM